MRVSTRMVARHFALTMSFVGAVTAMGSVSREAKADRTFLVGGTVIEGKATRKAGKVVVEVESGEITLPADSVARIEKSDSVVSLFESKHAALHTGDVKSRLELADYCRDHDMHGRERQVLQEVLEIDPNNGPARARLGYVKTEAGWVTEADAMRAKGMVQHEGQWMTPSELREIERRDAEVESRARDREAAETDLAARRAELANREAELEAEQNRMASRPFQTFQNSWGYSSLYFSPLYGTPYPAFYRANSAGLTRAIPRTAPHGGGSFDTSLSVVKVPYRHP